MTENDNETTAIRYLSAAGSEDDGRYRITADELARLVGLLTKLGQVRLSLLRGLQTALPRSEDDESLEDLKETLTNLIIMQSRTADREGGLAEDIYRSVISGAVESAVVDKAELKQGLVDLMDTTDRIRQMSGSGDSS